MKPSGDQKYSSSMEQARDPRKMPEAIQWHEGLLLNPQHYQQWSWRQEFLPAYHVQAAHPFPWGLRTLRINESLMGSGIFRVEELEAILPDGLVALHPLSEAAPLEIDLNEQADEIKARALDPLKTSLTIYLAVSARDRLNYVSSFQDRFLAHEGELIADENTGEGGVAIPRIRPRLRLLLRDEPPGAQFVGFPLTRVTLRGGSFSVTDYVPPLLECCPLAVTSPFQPPLTAIHDLCARLAANLREKAKIQREKLNSRSGSSMSASAILELREQIRSLVAALPAFEAVLYTPGVSPYFLWLAFNQLAGSLAALGNDPIPEPTKPYNHLDLRDTFSRVEHYIVRMLAEGVHEIYSPYAFIYEPEKRRFFLELKTDWLMSGDDFYISVEPSLGSESRDLVNWIHECYIGSESRIPEMESKRVRGAPREYKSRDEQMITSREAVLFHVKYDPEFIIPGEKLCIYNPADEDPMPLAASIAFFARSNPVAYYELTAEVLRELQAEMPADLVDRLRDLSGRVFRERDEFAAALEEILRAEEEEEFPLDQIIKRASRYGNDDRDRTP